MQWGKPNKDTGIHALRKETSKQRYASNCQHFVFFVSSIFKFGSLSYFSHLGPQDIYTKMTAIHIRASHTEPMLLLTYPDMLSEHHSFVLCLL